MSSEQYWNGNIYINHLMNPWDRMSYIMIGKNGVIILLRMLQQIWKAVVLFCLQNSLCLVLLIYIGDRDIFVHSECWQWVAEGWPVDGVWTMVILLWVSTTRCHWPGGVVCWHHLQHENRGWITQRTRYSKIIMIWLYCNFF